MSASTGIEWTDATWSPLRVRVKDNAAEIARAKGYTSLIQIGEKMAGRVGQHCEPVSEGCKHCYSGTWQARCLKVNGTGLPFDRRSRDLIETIVDEKSLRAPLHWKAPKRIFVENQSDLFGEWVPGKHIDLAFAVMSQSPQHTFQVLTKRPEQLLAYLTDERTQDGIDEAGTKLGWCHANVRGRWPLPNVWLGVSVEDFPTWDSRVHLLKETAAAKRFISYEPALADLGCIDLDGIDWVICGGESGPGARPMHPDWARSVRDQCVAASVAFFFKQWGEWAPAEKPFAYYPYGQPVRNNTSYCRSLSRYAKDNGATKAISPSQLSEGRISECILYEETGIVRVGKKKAGALLDGVEWRQFPS